MAQQEATKVKREREKTVALLPWWRWLREKRTPKGKRERERRG